MSRYNLAWMIAIPMAMLVGVTLSFSSPTRERDKEYKLVRTIVDVLAEVDQLYVRELDDKQKERLVEDMINGGLSKLDPHSHYMNPEEFNQFNQHTEGKFGGVGIHISVDQRSGMLMVLSPMFDTPAYVAGVLAGDIITKIDGKSTETMDVTDATRLIQGEPGTPISLTVVHEGTRKEETFDIKRSKIEVASVLGLNRRDDDLREWDWYADRASGIAFIRVIQFSDRTTADLKKVVERLDAEGAKALVLDLRDNPGGLLTSAIEVSDLFLTEGPIVSTRDRHGNGKQEVAKKDGTLFEPASEKPIAVLINKFSASASEIVSAALQDNKRAAVVGERSYGKGSVQKIRNLGGDPPTALKLTTDTYWRPSGANIHRHPDSKETDEWGVKPTPGLEVVMKDEERLEYLRYKRAKDIIHKDKPKEPQKPFQDRVLDKAVEHLKGVLKK